MRENGPLRRSGKENGPLRRGNAPLSLMGCFRSKKAHQEVYEFSMLFAFSVLNPQRMDQLESTLLSKVGMNGDTFSIKTPKECSKKFAATCKGKFLTRRNVLRIFFFILRRFWGASIAKVSPLRLL